MRAVDPLTALPVSLQAGDSYVIRLTDSRAPASAGWALRWVLAGAVTQAWDAVIDGSEHVFTLTAASTASLSGGTYQHQLRATLSAQVQTLQSGAVVVRPNITALAAGEGLSWARRTLTIVEAALANTATSEMKLYMINGRQVQSHTLGELMELRALLRAEVQTESAGGFGTPIRMTAVGFSS